MKKITDCIVRAKSRTTHSNISPRPRQDGIGRRINSVYLFFISFVVFFLLVIPALAAYKSESNTVTTKVGNPPISSESETDVLEWTGKLSNTLELGTNNGIVVGYNRRITPLTNGNYAATIREGRSVATIYWCTNLVIDAFNLAGIKGLEVAKHQAVVEMTRFWKKDPGYTYLDYTNGDKASILQQVKPGYAILFQVVPGQFGDVDHAAMVKSLTVDSRGNGNIETYDSNTDAKVTKYPIVNWIIKDVYVKTYTIGFGTSKS